MPFYDYTDYKEFLRSRLAHGVQKKLATHLNCQSAFLSQVLRGKPHLSLEQGILATEYFQLAGGEQEYFMLALQLARAGSRKLEKFHSDKMEKIRDQNGRVDARIGKHDLLEDLPRTQFFSSWKYAVIHVLLSLPVENQMKFLVAKTGLSEREINRVMEFLSTTKLIEVRAGNWRPTKKRIHLKPEDPLIGTHHKNFRSLSIGSLEDPASEALHYSSAIALSIPDADRIKNEILDLIAKTEVILKPSEEETSRILNIDYFELGKSRTN